MMMPVDPNKLIDLVIKYKNQVTYLCVVILAVILFFAGRYSVDCPPKSEVCKAELITITGLRDELAAKDIVRTEQLRAQRDADRTACDVRVEEAKREQAASNEFLECTDICSLHPQCVRAGRCR